MQDCWTTLRGTKTTPKAQELSSSSGFRCKLLSGGHKWAWTSAPVGGWLWGEAHTQTDARLANHPGCTRVVATSFSPSQQPFKNPLACLKRELEIWKSVTVCGPASRSSRRASRCPFCAARWAGVVPSFETEPPRQFSSASLQYARLRPVLHRCSEVRGSLPARNSEGREESVGGEARGSSSNCYSNSTCA